jgi:hypothetical protein
MKLPILLYHSISHPKTMKRFPGLCVRPALFKKHLQFLEPVT